MTTKPMVIVSAVTPHYVLPLAAMIKSVVGNSDPGRAMLLYVLDSGISPDQKQSLLSSWDRGRVTVQWVPVAESRLPDLPLWGRMNPSTYFRLLMPALLPHPLEKAIWLDGDLIVKRDLFSVWDMDPGQHSVLAVQDLVIPFVSSRYGVAPYRELGLAPDAAYFNAGVMVVNLSWWRRHDVTARVFDYLKRFRATTCFWDQEGLNAVLAGTWGRLDPRWNQIASVTGRSFFKPAHLEQAVYGLVTTDPWIVHYAGMWKPWIYYNQNPSRQLYYDYLDLTAWAGWRPRKTVGRMLLGVYESTLRSVLYPMEVWGMKILREWALTR
jgi:lipopolysaccharide biosynthesis glycosyltransferase